MLIKSDSNFKEPVARENIANTPFKRERTENNKRQPGKRKQRQEPHGPSLTCSNSQNKISFMKLYTKNLESVVE